MLRDFYINEELLTFLDEYIILIACLFISIIVLLIIFFLNEDFKIYLSMKKEGFLFDKEQKQKKNDKGI